MIVHETPPMPRVRTRQVTADEFDKLLARVEALEALASKKRTQSAKEKEDDPDK